MSNKPFQYQNPANPLIHQGVVPVTGSAEVDLGIGHDNFHVALNVKGAQAQLEKGPIIAWDYVSGRPGSFKISVSKIDFGGTDTDPHTDELNISFIAIAGPSAA